MLTFLILYVASVSQADVFQEHPAPAHTMECKPLDYESYHRALASKANLIRLNPDLKHPNFAGHYLLLKNELMMETLWLIADCASGKFFHENISGIYASFKLDSSALILKKKDLTEVHTWVEHEWIKIADVSPTATPATHGGSAPAVPPPSPVTANPLLSYEPIFEERATPELDPTCKKIDFDSNTQTQMAQKSIRLLNADLTHPNFAGHYLLIQNKILFDTLWFVADCRTGKILNSPLSGNAHFKPKSAFVILSTSAHFPKLLAWTEEQWQELPDPARPGIVKNTLYDESAKTIFKSIPNPHRDGKIRFNHLHCNEASETCSVQLSENSPTVSIETTLVPAVKKVLQNWGYQKQILDGTCFTERSRLICKIEIGAETH